MQQSRSILAVTTAIASITINSLPSQAFTWDDFFAVMDALGKTRRNPPPSNPAPPTSNGGFNNEQPPQSGGFGNDSPPNQPTYPQPIVPTQQPNSKPIACITTIGSNNFERIESTIPIRGRTLRVASRINLTSGSSYEIICKILRHPASERVRFGLAIADNSNLTSALVGVSFSGQNGVKRQRKDLFAGQARLMAINTSGVESFSIVLKPLNGGGYIYPIAVP